MDILVLILIVPFVFGAIMFMMPLHFKVLQNTHILLSVIVSAILLSAVRKVVEGNELSFFHHYLFLDSLGAIFLSLIAITGLLVNIYATTYMKWELEEGHISLQEVKNYFALSFIFTWTMSLSVVCNNIAFMWAAIEATTLASVFLVAVHKDKKSTESGYKYIVLCSIGLAFALYATILLYSAANGKIDVLTDIQARAPAQVDLTREHFGSGRELFSVFRQVVSGAEQGATIFNYLG